MSLDQTKQDVQEYYGETLGHSDDLKTDACCDLDAMAEHLKPLIKNIHSEVLDRFYGCGSPIPFALEGKTVLDLGCGTGRDSYILSQLVGPTGRIIGVDMTDQQLTVANRHIDYHMEKFGYDAPNVEFHKGIIEDLSDLPIEAGSVDLIVSNCVINLSSNKLNVFKEIKRLLKPNGELYFSDIFAGRRIPETLQKDKVILGECLGGAMYVDDFRRMLREVGFLDYRIQTRRRLDITDKEIIQKAGMIDFYSMTVRTFNTEFEDICENYGHVAYYKGTIAECPHSFVLDDHHTFNTGLPVPVCGNTAQMLKDSRYGKHFDVLGDFSTHYGPFDCADDASENENIGACC
jgi:arsenite methyltransferase